MKRIQVGDRAPAFTLADHSGRNISLGEFAGEKVVVLFFYPSDHTPICTREACGFRDAYDDFARAGAVVLGVSANSAESHRAFAAAHDLPFHLLVDPDGSLEKAFGVPKTLGLLPGRVTYVIDPAGIVRHVVNAPLAASRHAAEALDVVRRLTQGVAEATEQAEPPGKE